MLKLHLAVFLFGMAGVFGKSLALPASSIVLGRTACAALALGVWVALRGGSRVGLRGALALALSGALLAAHWQSFFRAVQCSSVVTALLAFATYPLFVSLLDPLFSRRRVRRTDWVAGALILAGLLLVAPPGAWLGGSARGVLWGLVSALTFALLTLANRRFVAGLDAASVALGQNLWATVFLSSAARPLLAMPAAQWGQVLALGVLCTALAHTLFIDSLKRVRPQVASVAAGLEPVYGAAMAYVLLGACPEWREVAGGCVIIATVAAVSWPRRRACAAGMFVGR